MANQLKMSLFLSLPNSTLFAILAILQSRWLGLEDRGTVVLILTISGSSAVIGSLGYGLARVTTPFMEVNLRDLLSRIYVSISLSLLIFLLISRIQDIDVDIWVTSFLIVSSLSYSCMFILTDILFQSDFAIHIRAISLSSIVLEILCNFLLNKASDLTIHEVFLANISIAIIGISIVMYFLKGKLIFEKNNDVSIFSNLTFLATYLSSFHYVYIYRLPASYVISPEDLALISVSFSFAFVGMPLIYFVMQFVRMNTFNGIGRSRKLNVLIIFTFLSLFLVALLEYLFAEDIVTKTVGIEFLESANLLRQIAFAVPFFGLTMILMSYRQGETKSSLVTLHTIYLLTSFFIIVFCGALYGPNGICLSVFLYNLILGCYSGFKLQNNLGNWPKVLE